jgi:hypothetical protein
MRRAETVILSPLGLDQDSFIRRQREMAPELLNRLATELLNFEPPDSAAIITGVDKAGPHLYLATNAEVTCQDKVGFASIGAGSWHANSQFMFAGHTVRKGFEETLLLVYSAKKRAEVAPGVGKATDMFMVGDMGGHVQVGDHVIQNLQQIYDKSQAATRRASLKANKRVEKYIAELNRPLATKPQATVSKDEGRATPSDGEGDRGETSKEEGKKTV